MAVSNARSADRAARQSRRDRAKNLVQVRACASLVGLLTPGPVRSTTPPARFSPHPASAIPAPPTTTSPVNRSNRRRVRYRLRAVTMPPIYSSGVDDGSDAKPNRTENSPALSAPGNCPHPLALAELIPAEPGRRFGVALAGRGNGLLPWVAQKYQAQNSAVVIHAEQVPEHGTFDRRWSAHF